MSVSVRQALKILELLAPHPDGLRVTDLAASLGVNRASAHRLLVLLADMGYVVQELKTERYSATFRLGALGLRQIESSGIQDWGQHRLNEIARRTRELVRLATVVDNHLVWIARAQGSNSSLIIDPASGADVTLHATATGKAYLSTLSAERVDELLNERGMAAMTDHTITDRARLEENLEDARHKGYAMVIEEMDLGISAIAAPIVLKDDPASEAVGTLSVAGPSARLDRATLESFAPTLLDGAAALAAEWPAYRHAKETVGAIAEQGDSHQ